MRGSENKFGSEYLSEAAAEHLEEGVSDEEGGEHPADLGPGPAEAAGLLPALRIRAVVRTRGLRAVPRTFLGELHEIIESESQ